MHHFCVHRGHLYKSGWCLGIDTRGALDSSAIAQDLSEGSRHTVHGGVGLVAYAHQRCCPQFLRGGIQSWFTLHPFKNSQHKTSASPATHMCSVQGNPCGLQGGSIDQGGVPATSQQRSRVSLSSCTHARTHTLTHSHTHTHTHSLSLPHTLTHTRTYTHSHTDTNTLTHSHTHSHTHTHTLTQTLTHSHTQKKNTDRHVDICTNTHIHTRCVLS